MEGLSYLPFFGLTDIEFINVCAHEKALVHELLEMNNINKYVLEHTIGDSNFGFEYYGEDKFNSQVPKENKIELSVFHLNIRSLNHNHQKLILYLESLNVSFDVIVLSEIWSYNVPYYANIMNGYTFIYELPTCGNVGGIAMYVRSDLDFTMLNKYNVPQLSKNNVENIWIKIRKEHKTYIVGGIYRHPNGDIKEFSDVLEKTLERITKEKKTAVVSGDFNINLLNHNKNGDIQSYMNAVLTTDFLPAILMPTRITGYSATLIDHIYVHQPGTGNSHRIMAGNFYADITDHLPNFLLLSSDEEANSRYNDRKMIRLMTQKHMEEFRNKIQEVKWENVTNKTDAELAYNNFVATILLQFEKCFPMVRCSRKRTKDKPWITSGIKISSNRKNRLYKQWITKKRLKDKQKYETYAKIFKKCVADSQSAYYREIFNDRKESVKNMWRHLGQLLNPQKHNKQKTQISRVKINNTSISDPQLIAEELNSYFCSVGETLADSLPNSQNNYSDYMKKWVSESMFVTPITENEVVTETMKLNPRKAPGHDNLTPKLLQHVIDLIAEPLTYIYNLSVETGVVPSHLKISKVIPLYKKGDRWEPSNYRPISLLNVFDKVLEKLIHKRLMNFINRNDILYENQFGFRPKHSTTLAVLELVDTIYQNLDKKYYVAGIYLDLKKAFDTVDHDILLNKLHIYGIRGKIWEWFKSYLKNRQQYLVVNECISSCREIQYGVPQGSVLGPVLFSLYVNDINYAVRGETLKLYADDTNLFLYDSSIDSLCMRANLSLESLYQWFLANKLSVSFDKTVYSIFLPNRIPDTGLKPFRLYVNNIEIKRENCCKYLGIMLDEELSWRNHIEYIEKKLIKLTSLFYKIRQRLTPECRKALYFSMVYPHLTYAVELYGGAPESNIHKLQILQNKFLKILQLQGPRFPTSKLYINYNTHKIHELHEISLLHLIHKIIYHPSELPKIYANYLTFNCIVHDHDTRHKNDIFPHHVKTIFGTRDFKFKSHLLWNNLPEEIKLTDSIPQFRRKIRNFYLTLYCQQ